MKIVLQVFDLLYVNGKSLLRESLRVSQAATGCISYTYIHTYIHTYIIHTPFTRFTETCDLCSLHVLFPDAAGAAASLFYPGGGIPHFR